MAADREPSNRIGVIQAVTKPINFFSLVVLVVEAILGVTANFSQGMDRTYLIVGMISLIFLLVIIVAVFSFVRPEALRGERVDPLRRGRESTSASLSDAVNTFDRLSDEIEATITNQPQSSNIHPRGYLIRRIGNNLVAYQRMQSFSEDHFDQLPADIKRQIETYKKSMQRLYREWESIKRSSATSQLDPQVREKQLNLIKSMKGDLVGIIDVLQQAGFFLDDHYLKVRSLLLQLK